MTRTSQLSDLKIIDELLVIMKGPNQTWAELEGQYNITAEAMARLRQAWANGEMSSITLSLADYFDGGSSDRASRSS